MEDYEVLAHRLINSVELELKSSPGSKNEKSRLLFSLMSDPHAMESDDRVPSGLSLSHSGPSWPVGTGLYQQSSRLESTGPLSSANIKKQGNCL